MSRNNKKKKRIKLKADFVQFSLNRMLVQLRLD